MALSDYEIARAKNIERNNAKLRELGLISALEEKESNDVAWKRRTLGIAASKPDSCDDIRESPTPTARKRKLKSPEQPSRKSLRLQGCEPDGVELVVTPSHLHVDVREPTREEWRRRTLECREVRQRAALRHAELGAEAAAKENPTATYEHCLMRVRTMTDKALANRVRVIERAAGKHCVIKMAIFKSCLQDEEMWDLAKLAGEALERLKALQPPPED